MRKKFSLLVCLSGIIMSSMVYAAPQDQDIDTEELFLYFVNRGDEESVQKMLDIGVNVNGEDKYADTPLILAAKSGNESMACLLLQAGADANRGDTAPLSWAAIKGHESIIRLLLDAGAEVNTNIQSPYRDTPLLFAARYNNKPTIVQLLLDAGAAVNYRNVCGATPLFLAAKNGHKSIISLLLKAGAEVNYRNVCGATPLAIAIRYKCVPAIRLLLEYGAHWPENLPQLFEKSSKEAFNNRKKAIEGFFSKLTFEYNIPNDVSYVLKKLADVPEEHGPLGTGGRFEYLKEK